jgi:ABC-type transport system involved in multi-copper enzyme maturation permease subunit
MPVPQLDVALAPGVTVTVQVALGANVPVHVVGTSVIFVPVGNPVASTDTPVAEFAPLVIVITLALPVKAVLSVLPSTLNPKVATLGVNVVVAVVDVAVIVVAAVLLAENRQYPLLII